MKFRLAASFLLCTLVAPAAFAGKSGTTEADLYARVREVQRLKAEADAARRRHQQWLNGYRSREQLRAQDVAERARRVRLEYQRYLMRIEEKRLAESRAVRKLNPYELGRIEGVLSRLRVMAAEKEAKRVAAEKQARWMIRNAERIGVEEPKPKTSSEGRRDTRRLPS